MDPFAPAPVEPTRSSKVLALSAAAWADLHIVAVIVWLVTGFGIARNLGGVGLAIYLLTAAILTGIGGLCLLYAKAIGRRFISWGQWLFTIAMLWLLAFALRMPSSEHVTDELRGMAGYILLALAGHLIIDVALGTAAQRVGRPAGWKPALEPTLEPTPQQRHDMQEWAAAEGGPIE